VPHTVSQTKIIFMGTPEFAVPSLLALADAEAQAKVVAVVTQPDRRAGRGRKMQAPPVKLAALARNIEVLQPTKLKSAETFSRLQEYDPELIVVAAYGRILPPSLLELPRYGCVNVHASLLPRHRGASPINHAIIAGDAETGVSIMRMDEGLDTGTVYARAALPIPADATCAALGEQLSRLGADLLGKTLPGIVDGSLQPEPQSGAEATYAPLLTKEDGRLDFSLGAEELARRVRGLQPWPGAFSFIEGARLRVAEAHVVDTATGSDSSAPGQVLAAGAEGVVICCGTGALCLDTVQPAGKKIMPAAAWVAGRGVQVGARFES